MWHDNRTSRDLDAPASRERETTLKFKRQKKSRGRLAVAWIEDIREF